MSFLGSLKSRAKQVYSYNLRPAVRHTVTRAKRASYGSAAGIGYTAGYVKDRAKVAYAREKQNRLQDKYLGGGRAWSTRIEQSARKAYGTAKKYYQAERERRRDVAGTGNSRYYASGLMKRKGYLKPRYSKSGSHALNKARYLYRKSRRY